MSAPKSAPWDSLPPWDKAAQWHRIAPHVADEMMALSRELGLKQWEFQLGEARHRRGMEIALAEHQRLMDVRLWVTQIVAMAVGLANIGVLALVAWHYADAGNLAPGLTVFGAGASVTIAVLAVARSIANRMGKPLPVTAAEVGSLQ